MSCQNIGQEWLESLTEPEGILKETQEEARVQLKEIGFPNKKDEAWRLTNLKSIENLLTLPLDIKKDSYSEQNLSKLPIEESEEVFRIINISSKNGMSLNSLPKGIRMLNKNDL